MCIICLVVVYYFVTYSYNWKQSWYDFEEFYKIISYLEGFFFFNLWYFAFNSIVYFYISIELLSISEKPFRNLLPFGRYFLRYLIYYYRVGF